MAAVGLGLVAGPPLGGVLYFKGGKLLPFAILTGVTVIDGVLLLLIRTPANEAPVLAEVPAATEASQDAEETNGSGAEASEDEAAVAGEPGGLLSLLLNPEVIRLCVVYMNANLFAAVFDPTLPLFLTDTFGATPQDTGLVMLAIAGAYVVVTPLIASFGGRWSRHAMGAIGIVVMGVSAPLTALPVRDSLYYVLPPLIAFGAGFVRAGYLDPAALCPASDARTSLLARLLSLCLRTHRFARPFAGER